MINNSVDFKIILAEIEYIGLSNAIILSQYSKTKIYTYNAISSDN